MITGRCLYKKTNDVPWDKFIDPSKMDPMDPLYPIWNTLQPEMIGAVAMEKFPGMTATPHVDSLQQLRIEYTFQDNDQVQAWLDNINSFDLMPAQSYSDFMDMMFGENVQDEVIIDN